MGHFIKDSVIKHQYSKFTHIWMNIFLEYTNQEPRINKTEKVDSTKNKKMKKKILLIVKRLHYRI